MADSDKEKLESILKNIPDSKEEAGGKKSSLFGFLSEPAQAAAKPADKKKTAAESAPEATDQLKKLEAALHEEKEKAMKFEILLKERENVRLEMENTFKTMREQLKQEKLSQDLESERINARARVETLEKRLEEMHQLLLDLMKESKSTDKDEATQKMYAGLLERERELLEQLKNKDAEMVKAYAAFEEKRELIKKEMEASYGETRDALEKENFSLKKDLGELTYSAELSRRLTQENHDLAAKLKEVSQAFEAKERLANELLIKNMEAKSQSSALASENHLLKEKLNKQDKEIAAFAESLRQLKDDCDRLTRDAAQTHCDNEIVREDLKAAKARLVEANQELTLSKKRLMDLLPHEETIERLRRDKAFLLEQNKTLQESSGQKDKEAADKIYLLTSQNDLLQMDTEPLKKSLESLQAEKIELKKSILELRNELAQAAVKLEELERYKDYYNQTH